MKIIEILMLDIVSVLVIIWAYNIIWLDNYYTELGHDSGYLIRTGMILLIVVTLYININLGKL
jgi:hypothetical protein